jgi:hypothetical protein
MPQRQILIGGPSSKLVSRDLSTSIFRSYPSDMVLLRYLIGDLIDDKLIKFFAKEFAKTKIPYGQSSQQMSEGKVTKHAKRAS